MNIHKLKSLPVVTAALLLSSMTTVQAYESGAYIGAGMGSYSIDVNNLDKNDDVIKALIGMQFNDMFGVEASLTDKRFYDVVILVKVVYIDAVGTHASANICA